MARYPWGMVDEAISIEPQDAPSLLDVRRVLQQGQAKLVGPQGEDAVLPEPLYALLQDIVKRLSNGHSIVLIPEEKQLTTQQAGELLGLSRPHLIQLIDTGEMPYGLVGKHRRIALRDVLSFAKRRAAARKSALDKMARDAFEAGLYENAEIPEGGQDQ